MKRIGILSPMFSLPNEFGIGDFSDCSFKFIDYLSSINYSYWQILPLSPVDKYNSPYASISSYAIDDIYVSIPKLKEEGYIDNYQIYSNKVKRVNYLKVRRYKNFYFKLAYDRFISKQDAREVLKEFIDKQKWVIEYASYIALKRKNNNIPWNQWKQKALTEEELYSLGGFEIFKQYILFKQWDDIHQYAKEHKIDILGDIPFYVGYDSQDVYFNQKCFLLKEDRSPSKIAGVPPDYYNPDGQLWGNPIYDWDYQKNNDFSFIINRIIHASKLYDVVRLDHFRAFDTYYMIDANMDNAKVGEWKETPSYELFSKLYYQYPKIRLVAEDLGYLREEVYNLRDRYKLPGMQVCQFSLIDEEIRHNNLPHVYKRENSIIYLSTHDSETSMQWYLNLDADTRNSLNQYLAENYGNHHIMTDLFKYVASQPADTVILTVWDILRLGRSARINVPGFILKKNWTWRFNDFDSLYKNENKLVKIARDSNRS